MKTLLTITSILFLASTLFSCRGRYQCVCTNTTQYVGGNTETGMFSKSYTGPELHAKNNCNKATMQYSVAEYTYTSTCELK